MPRINNLAEVLFKVKEQPVFVSLQENGVARRLGVPEKKAIVNLKNQHVLGIVSRCYRLVPNEEALNLAYKCCRTIFPETSPAEWDVTAVDAPSTAGYCHIDLSHNSTVLDFNALPPSERPDVFGPFIRVTNSYNGLRALGFDVGFYRKVCKNGMIVPDTIVRFNFTHMQREIGETIQFLIARDRLEKFKTTFADSLVNLRTCAVPRTNFEPVVCSVLCLHPPEPMKPGGPHESDWQTLHSQITEMCNRYASELGETAYAIFNVVTELASRPPANRCLHRDRNSLQRLAGSWLKSFNDAYRRPDFSLGNHLEQLAKERSSTARSRTSNDAIN